MSRGSRSYKNSRRHRRRRMKRYLPKIVMGTATLVIATAVLLFATSKGSPKNFVPEYTGGPRIDLSQEVYDYGYVKLDTTITTDVEISNVGDKPLRITDIPEVQVLEGC